MKANEHQEAVSLIQWRDYQTSRYPVLASMYHIPNGGDRHVAVAAKLKAEGTMPGVADYHLPAAYRGYFSLYIELKTMSKTSRQSKTQKGFELMVTDLNNMYIVAKGWLAAKEAIIWYVTGNLTEVLDSYR